MTEKKDNGFSPEKLREVREERLQDLQSEVEKFDKLIKVHEEKYELRQEIYELVMDNFEIVNATWAYQEMPGYVERVKKLRVMGEEQQLEVLEEKLQSLKSQKELAQDNIEGLKQEMRNDE